MFGATTLSKTAFMWHSAQTTLNITSLPILLSVIMLCVVVPNVIQLLIFVIKASAKMSHSFCPWQVLGGKSNICEWNLNIPNFRTLWCPIASGRLGRHVTQYDDVQHNNTKHKGLFCYTQHDNDLHPAPLCWVSLCWMLNAIVTGVVWPNISLLAWENLPVTNTVTYFSAASAITFYQFWDQSRQTLSLE
jgi:hypothetical protein